MKKLLLPFLLLLSSFAMAQYSNSWIDYTKTYYKFRITTDGLCRIPQSAISAIGLAATNADNFQLWRNGEQVRLYTSVSGAQLGTSDYVEFWGKANDGKPDTKLYKKPDFQLADKYSLFSDTAMYFLTVNEGGNLRFASATNGTPGTATPDAYFMRDENIYYKSVINPGYAEDAGELVYSSSFDDGEGWTTASIAPASPFTQQFTNLNVYNAGPTNSVTIRVNAFGNAPNNRRLKISFNNDSLYGIDMNRYVSRKVVLSNQSLSLLTATSTPVITVAAVFPGLATTDRIVVGSMGITYPATFNFNNAKNFEFNLAASATGNYLLIDNFSNGSVAPVLYNVTEGRRYLGDITSNPGKVRFVLPASTLANRNFILISQETTNIRTVSSFTSKTFLNLANAANQGEYIIISHPSVYNDPSGTNQVELYRQYRASVAGGGYNAKIIDINELQDQFGFGIYKHPSSIREFALNAIDNWSVKPKYIMLIGRGISYNNYPTQATPADYFQLNFIPTFGWPAADNLLTARPGLIAPTVPIGRLAAVNGNEIKLYLQKLKEYELAQATPGSTIASKAWMKNFMHVIGGKNESESTLFEFYMNRYKAIAQAPMMGAHVETFKKTSNATIEQANSARIDQLFREGLGFIKYFGHSSATTFEFNLSTPTDYNNPGKYPFFFASGCNAGEYYRYDPSRLTGTLTLSEKYILAPQRGSIGFLASTHFGIPQYLDSYNNNFYKLFSNEMYGNTVGNQMKKNIEDLGGLNPNLNFYFRMHLEENSLHGDPALRINYSAKPDYVIEEPLVKINPNIISVADAGYTVNVKYQNIGKSTNDSIWISVKRQLPDNSIQTIYNQLKLAVRDVDSITIPMTISPLVDKGLNKIIVALDYTNRVDELFESNNTVTKEFFIFEDELRPVYPYNFSIVNQNNITFSASTANPLSTTRQYVMEIDTTEMFNSSFKKTYNTSGVGGVIQFTPNNITFTDSTVYYWRVAIVPQGTADYIYNSFSFVYLAGSSTGFNQSHYFQHLKSTFSNVQLDTDRKFKFTSAQRNITIRTGLFPHHGFDVISVNVDFTLAEQYGCRYSSLQFTVFDPFTLKLWENRNISATNGLYGSATICNSPTRKFFEFIYSDAAQRKAAMDFIDLIPEGMYVGITNLGRADNNTSFINQWQADQATLGTGNSLYHKLKSIGFTQIDSFTRNLPFMYFYKKGSTSFAPVQAMGQTPESFIDQAIPVVSSNIEGTITSPLYGPAGQWQAMHWRGTSNDPNPPGGFEKVEVIGVKNDGTETSLAIVAPAIDSSLSFVNAATYPYLRLKLLTKDTIYATPNQLRYLRVNATYVPEGAVAPNIAFNAPDTVFAGEDYNFSLAFKNISPVKFDSLIKIKFIITDKNNVPHPIVIPPGKALVSGDTLMVNYRFNTLNYPGQNTLFIEFNPDFHQPEQYHFNNILYKNFFAKADVFNPTLDVTFDAVHILNRDIVSSNPHILVKLKDENKFATLKDTALLKVQVRFPDQSLRTYHFNNDTMRFIPAAPGSADNTASIEFNPYFTEDGEYELIVSGRDVNGNKAGNLDYSVIFSVINKPMISNLLNYPNPFTTSTAFVFTLTGNEIPQNMRIQILTVTGKVVREITQNELGPIHVGRNITEYKWDGTDMYGQKLANGVYLYRVITNLNGKKLDSYKASGDDTDKFFNKGYGKMYLMR